MSGFGKPTRSIKASAQPVYDYIRAVGPITCAEVSNYLGRDVQKDIRYLQDIGAIRKAGRAGVTTRWRWQA